MPCRRQSAWRSLSKRLRAAVEIDTLLGVVVLLAKKAPQFARRRGALAKTPHHKAQVGVRKRHLRVQGEGRAGARRRGISYRPIAIANGPNDRRAKPDLGKIEEGVGHRFRTDLHQPDRRQKRDQIPEPTHDQPPYAAVRQQRGARGNQRQQRGRRQRGPITGQSMAVPDTAGPGSQARSSCRDRPHKARLRGRTVVISARNPTSPRRR